eukprot:494598-Rhodomonas_salina.2
MAETPYCTAPNLNTQIYVQFENDFAPQPARMARGGAEYDDGYAGDYYKGFSTGASLNNKYVSNTGNCCNACGALTCQLFVLSITCGTVTHM